MEFYEQSQAKDIAPCAFLEQPLDTQTSLASPAWTAHFEYDVMGRKSLRRLLGGVESQTRYGRSGRVTDQVTKGTGYEVGRRAYEWDLSGKLRRLTAGKYTAEFDYDVWLLPDTMKRRS